MHFARDLHFFYFYFYFFLNQNYLLAVCVFTARATSQGLKFPFDKVVGRLLNIFWLTFASYRYGLSALERTIMVVLRTIEFKSKVNFKFQKISLYGNSQRFRSFSSRFYLKCLVIEALHIPRTVFFF